jgi:lipopolysaccharide export system ATP-binding protein
VKQERFPSLPGLVGEGLVVDNIGKSFRGRPVVKGVSLRLARGEVAGLLGPNGAGKTTCFYMITGLVPADYGAIYLDGEDITAQPMYQRARMGVGYLPQETSIFRGMTVGENVMAVVELREKDRKRARETVTALLEELHIEHLRNAPAVSLSGGERRRAGEVLFEGRPDEIVDDPEVRRVYLGDRFG